MSRGTGLELAIIIESEPKKNLISVSLAESYIQDLRYLSYEAILKPKINAIEGGYVEIKCMR